MIRTIKDKIKEKPLLFFLSLFFPISIWRFFKTFIFAWNCYNGELLANFPFYFRLKNYNPLLYYLLKAYPDSPWFPNAWFYGPIHHLWLFPLTFFANSIDLFFRLLLIFYVCLIIGVLFLLYNAVKKNRDYLFLIAYFTITLGSFVLLDNLTQRNVELFEFSLITIAYLYLKKNCDYIGGSLLCFAAMAKLLPFIFFPYLLIKRNFKAAISFLVTFVVIVIFSQIALGWQNCQLFNLAFMAKHGLISPLEAILGKTFLTPIRNTSCTFYGFILSFFSKIDMSKQIPDVTYKINNFLVPNLIYLVIVLFIVIVTFLLFFKTRRKGDLLYEFSIVCLLMLLIYPHTNPHYYIFTLFAFISILKMCTCNLVTYGLSIRSKFFLFFIFLISLLTMGNLVPFKVYDFFLPLKNMAFHYFTTYNIFALGTFILWCLMMWIYYLDYKTIR